MTAISMRLVALGCRVLSDWTLVQYSVGVMAPSGERVLVGCLIPVGAVFIGSVTGVSVELGPLGMTRTSTGLVAMLLGIVSVKMFSDTVWTGAYGRHFQHSLIYGIFRVLSLCGIAMVAM